MPHTDSLFEQLAAHLGPFVECTARPAPPVSRELRDARRADLAVLLARAGEDPSARQEFLEAILPSLRWTAARLTRAWRADWSEVDQAVLAEAWSQIDRLAGRRLDWPEHTVVGRTRTAVRDSLRRERCRRERFVLTDSVPERCGPGGAGYGLVDAADVIRRAVRAGVVSAEGARIVWATRVGDVPVGRVTESTGRSRCAVLMSRCRAERAIRDHVRGGSGEAA